MQVCYIVVSAAYGHNLILLHDHYQNTPELRSSSGFDDLKFPLLTRDFLELNFTDQWALKGASITNGASCCENVMNRVVKFKKILYPPNENVMLMCSEY